MPLKIECTAIAPTTPCAPPPPLKKGENEKMIERGQKRQVASQKPKITLR